MIYTFSFNDDFLNGFSNDLTSKDATVIYQFINTNFIKRDNFYLRVDGKRKNFFNRNITGGNSTLLKMLISKLSRKYKNFPKKLKKTDFTFSNNLSKNEETISFEKIFKSHISIEESLDINCKSYWQYSNKDSDQSNKRNLSKYLKRIVDHSDEIFLIDRHVPRTICQSKSKSRNEKHINYANSYLNSFEFFNSILKNNLNKNRFYCGLQSGEFNKFENEGLNIENILKDTFLIFKDSKIIVHVLSKYEAYNKLHERLIIGLIKDEFFVMLRTEKGLNILDENFEFHKNKRKFDFVREEIALDDWQDWNLTVRHEKPKLQLYIA